MIVRMSEREGCHLFDSEKDRGIFSPSYYMTRCCSKPLLFCNRLLSRSFALPEDSSLWTIVSIQLVAASTLIPGIERNQVNFCSHQKIN